MGCCGLCFLRDNAIQFMSLLIDFDWQWLTLMHEEQVIFFNLCQTFILSTKWKVEALLLRFESPAPKRPASNLPGSEVHTKASKATKAYFSQAVWGTPAFGLFDSLAPELLLGFLHVRINNGAQNQPEALKITLFGGFSQQNCQFSRCAFQGTVGYSNYKNPHVVSVCARTKRDYL